MRIHMLVACASNLQDLHYAHLTSYEIGALPRTQEFIYSDILSSCAVIITKGFSQLLFTLHYAIYNLLQLHQQPQLLYHFQTRRPGTYRVIGAFKLQVI